jgi:uncharacterized coiled-coil protein SlyX
MSQSNGLSSLGLIDYLRESTETALDLSKNLTAAQSPGDFLSVWTRFAEGQYTAMEKLTYRLTGRTLAVMENRGMENRAMHRSMQNGQANGSSHPGASAAAASESTNAEDAALLSELQDQADSLRSQVDSLNAQVAALTEKLAVLEGRPLKVKFSFGEPPHTGWTPTKVVVLGNDGNGNLVELPSTIEEGGFRYTGAPSFWLAIG